MGRKSSNTGRGRSYWAGVIAKYEARPCSHEEFASRNGLNVGTFRSWLYRLRAEGFDTSEASEAPSGFVEVVRSTPEVPDESRCTVRVGDTEVVFTKTPSTNYLAELLRELAK
jgi:hypothetical protein